MCEKLMCEKLIESLNNLRIDVELNSFGDSTGISEDKYMRANEMLDDCIDVVRDFFDSWGY